MKKILTVVGARPQFIKAAVVSRHIKQHPMLTEVMIHTGQHYDYNMSEVFFEELEIAPPAYNLSIGSGSHGAQTGQMLEALEEVMLAEKPEMVLLYGDTNSTLAGAIAASKLLIPVVHVEAGLRSFNKAMPEEINRIMTDHVSALLFCPTDSAVENLRKEGIEKGVVRCGDVMYDSVLFYGSKPADTLERLGLESGSFCLLTCHRPENTNYPERLRSIFSALGECGKSLVLPAHPRLQSYLDTYQISLPPNIRMIPPASYMDMIQLEKHSEMIITDSGGVQKEAYFFEKPCVTLRDQTEWVETVEAGWNQVVGADSGSNCYR